MKSFNPNLYTAAATRARSDGCHLSVDRDLLIWLGAASCWVATQEVARAFGYQPSLGRPLFGHVYSPFELVAWAIKFDHPARFGLEIHQVFVHAYAIVVARERPRYLRCRLDGCAARSTACSGTPTFMARRTGRHRRKFRRPVCSVAIAAFMLELGATRNRGGRSTCATQARRTASPSCQRAPAKPSAWSSRRCSRGNGLRRSA